MRCTIKESLSLNAHKPFNTLRLFPLSSSRTPLLDIFATFFVVPVVLFQAPLFSDNQ